MGKKRNRVAIGIEITDDFIKLAQMTESVQGPVVEAVKLIASPPRAVVNGKFLDINSIADYIAKALLDADFTAHNIVLAYDDTLYIKGVEAMPNIPDSEMVDLVHERMAGVFPLITEDYQLGYQRESYVYNENVDQHYPVMYAGIVKSRLESLQEIAELLPNNLVAVDVVPLASNRAVLWPDSRRDQHMVMVMVSPTYVDLSIVNEGQYLAASVIRKDYSSIVEDSASIDDFIQRIHHFLLAFYNQYPGAPTIDKMIVTTTREGIKELITPLQDAFTEFECEWVRPNDNFIFNRDVFNQERLKENLNTYLPAMGLAMRFLERGNHSLSLTKVRLQMDPIINRIELGIGVLGAAAALAVMLGTGWYLDRIDESTQAEIGQNKEKIESLASGKLILDEQRLSEIKREIASFDQYRDADHFRHVFLNLIVETLPDDLTFDSVRIDKDQQVIIKGGAYLSDSILKFHQSLEDHFTNVEVKKMDLQNDKQGVPLNRFEIVCVWSS